MAIYHFECKVIGRSSGRSVVAAAAYRAGTRLVDEETDEIKDYRRKGGIAFHEVLLPKNAPEEYRDQRTLWNAVQKVEKRKDAQLAREVEVALPAELTRQQQIGLVRNFIQKNFVSQGMIADWALHDKGDGNPHAHILLTVRGIDEQGKWMNKKRSIFANGRDQNGKPIYDPSKPVYDPRDKENTKQYRIPALDKNGNQKTCIREGHGTEYLWEKITIPTNDWNDQGKVEEWRASWENCCNEYLEPENRIDHRSYARQRIDRIPTIHEGYAARKMSQAGHVSERCEINKSIKEDNEKINDSNREIKTGRDWISVRYLAKAAMYCRKKAIDENDFSEMMKKYGYGVEWQHSSDKIIFIVDPERKITNDRLGKCVEIDFSWETLNQEFNRNKASTSNKGEASKKEETSLNISERKKENTFASNEIPAGTIVYMDGRNFSVQQIDYNAGMVLLLDLTALEKSGQSMERIEAIDNVMDYLHQPQQEDTQKPATKTASDSKASIDHVRNAALKKDAQSPNGKAPQQKNVRNSITQTASDSKVSPDNTAYSTLKKENTLPPEHKAQAMEDDRKVTESKNSQPVLHTEDYYRDEFEKITDPDKRVSYAEKVRNEKVYGGEVAQFIHKGTWDTNLTKAKSARSNNEHEKFNNIKTDPEKLDYANNMINIIKKRLDFYNLEENDLSICEEMAEDIEKNDLNFWEKMAEDLEWQLRHTTTRDNINVSQPESTVSTEESLQISPVHTVSLTIVINKHIINELKQIQQQRWENHGYKLTPGQRLYFKRWEYTFDFIRKPETPQEEEKRLKEEVERIQLHEEADAVIAEAVKQIEETQHEGTGLPHATSMPSPTEQEQQEEESERPEEPNNSPTATITQAVQTETEEEAEEIGEEEFREWLQGFNAKYDELTDRIYSAQGSANYISYEDNVTIGDICRRLSETYHKVYQKGTGDFQETIYLYEVDQDLSILENAVNSLENKLIPKAEPDLEEEEIVSHGAR